MPDKSFKRDQVVEIIGSVVRRIAHTKPADDALSHEIDQLKHAIDQMREDLNLANPGQISFDIPSATEQLGVIVSTTETATHVIMGACEVIQGLLKDKPLEETASIEAEIIRIVEACTFQDLTGQRISKVVKSLNEIDRRISDLSKILNERFASLKEAAPAEPIDSLMNGPQLPGQGISQEEIDKLLNDF